MSVALAFRNPLSHRTLHPFAAALAAALTVAVVVAATGCARPPALAVVNVADRDLLDVSVPKLQQLYAD